MKEYIQSPEWQAVQQKAGAIRPEAYNSDALRDAHRLINFDSEVAKARVTGNDAAVNAIQNAAGGGSVLDRATKEHGSGPRSLSNMPTEETANLGMNDLKAIEDQLRAEGINPEDL